MDKMVLKATLLTAAIVAVAHADKVCPVISR